MVEIDSFKTYIVFICLLKVTFGLRHCKDKLWKTKGNWNKHNKKVLISNPCVWRLAWTFPWLAIWPNPTMPPYKNKFNGVKTSTYALQNKHGFIMSKYGYTSFTFNCGAKMSTRSDIVAIQLCEHHCSIEKEMNMEQ